MNPQHLFDAVHTLPNPSFKDRYDALVGLDSLKSRLEKEAQALIRPDLFEEWSKKHHKEVLPIVSTVLRRPPLLIFAGDVGTGKTEMATTIGDRIARLSKLDIELHSLSLRSRGTGAVGEMTTLVSEAFRVFLQRCPKRVSGAKPKGASLLLIDEADALAQSRELAQMHHEDRAGVNALIRGIDDLANANAACMVLMCTNRLSALDPAVQRRASAIFQFERPSEQLVAALLNKQLEGVGLSASEIDHLAIALANREPRGYSFTFSDITQRVLPGAVLAAFPDRRLTAELLSSVIHDTAPTPPFRGS